MSKRYVFDMRSYANFNDNDQIVVYVNDEDNIDVAIEEAREYYERMLSDNIWDYVEIEAESMDNKDYDIDDGDAIEIIDNADSDEPVKRMFSDEIEEENNIALERRLAELAVREREKHMEEQRLKTSSAYEGVILSTTAVWD